MSPTGNKTLRDVFSKTNDDFQQHIKDKLDDVSKSFNRGTSDDTRHLLNEWEMLCQQYIKQTRDQLKAIRNQEQQSRYGPTAVERSA